MQALFRFQLIVLLINCMCICVHASPKWQADNGNGTYSNPLFYEEFEDPDIIRVGEDYYLVGTTMHMNPALQIMHSKDLVNWELIGYCMDRLDLGPAFRLEDGRGIYGRGIWAPCIRYHNGMFYIFSNVNGVGLQVFRSSSIYGPWERNQLPGRHDLSVLFDDDGKVYLISGNRNPYPIEELTPDLKSFVPNSRRMMDAPGMGEGHHLYKINGKYYDISAIPGATTDQVVARADSIDGPWTVERMVQGESLGVTTVALDYATDSDRGLTLHQGGMCDTPSGEWWSVIMSDHGSAGRMVSLVPITWDNGFPLIGLPGNLRKAPNTWIKPNTGYTQVPKPAFVHDDNFDSGKLNIEWQWNHVPDESKWSLSEKPGVLRLHSLPAGSFYSARNSLCQRPPGPESIMTVELDTTGMVEGDSAGLALLSSPYAWIGVVKSSDGATLQMFDSTGSGRGRRGAPTTPAKPPTISADSPPKHLWLRVACNFDNDKAIFSWSADGKEFTPLGNPFTMTFQLRTFQGVRPSLFHYNTSGEPGGYADFDNYTVDEPRARGIERQIPIGKTIVLTSGADGSYLAADLESSNLVNIPAKGDVPAIAKFKVVDLGKGRVMLETSNDKVVSVHDNDLVLKYLGNNEPGDAESFQWVNLMHGDTMLMSLTNHRYLVTKPNSPGRVTATATGPNPARKGGVCFRWNDVSVKKTSLLIHPSDSGKPISPELFGIFFEDIGAQPLPVVSAGVCCQHAGRSPGRGQEGLPLDEMPGYIQDVLDPIEWANGPAASEWGKVRAEAGHPEPFGLQYIGVGNEDAITPIFKVRFKMIYDVLKEKHPEITVIGTVGPFASGSDYDNGWDFANKLQIEMVDEHYYVSPQWFWDNQKRYDSYDRDGAKVYLGEYAAHDDRRRTTMRSALAEAAYLTSLERNGDVVSLASYAPLLGKIGRTQWNPDLIYFTNTDVFPTINYYVQKMFGNNAGDRYFETKVDGLDDSVRFAVSTVRDSKTGDWIVKLVNGDGESRPLHIDVSGLGINKETPATVTSLSGDPMAINDARTSDPLVSKTKTIAVNQEFDYTVPATSLTVIRIDAN